MGTIGRKYDQIVESSESKMHTFIVTYNDTDAVRRKLQVHAAVVAAVLDAMVKPVVLRGVWVIDRQAFSKTCTSSSPHWCQVLSRSRELFWPEWAFIFC